MIYIYSIYSVMLYFVQHEEIKRRADRVKVYACGVAMDIGNT